MINVVKGDANFRVHMIMSGDLLAGEHEAISEAVRELIVDMVPDVTASHNERSASVDTVVHSS
jgi:hypothetical protein